MNKNLLFLVALVTLCLIGFSSVPSILVNSTSDKVLDQTFNKKVNIKFPESMHVVQDFYNGTESTKEEVLASVHFNDEKMLLRGYVQLWNIADLKTFLVTSQKNSTFDFKTYSLREVEVGEIKGFTTEWTASYGNTYRISGKEYWLKKEGSQKVLRISFFTDANFFTEEQLSEIANIIGTFHWD